MEKMVKVAELLLFDLDGLLVDTEFFHWKAYQAAIETFGIYLSWDFEKYLALSGSSATAIQDALRLEYPSLFDGRTWNDIYIEKKKQLQRVLLTHEIPLMPGAKSFIEEYLYKPMAVVTNSPQAFTELVKEQHPFLSIISSWIYREKYTAPKPSPEGYLLACREMNVDPTKALGFEDSLRGVDALLQAGCTPILVNEKEKGFRRICTERNILVLSSFTDVLVSNCVNS